MAEKPIADVSKPDESAKPKSREIKSFTEETKPAKRPVQSAIKPISNDFSAEKKVKPKQPDDIGTGKKIKAGGIAHFDTAVQTNDEFKEDMNDKY